MLTETEARDLLARAAASIDVTAGNPALMAPPRRARWLAPVIGVAAAVAMIVAGAAVTRDGSTSKVPPVTRPTPPDHVSQAAGQIPSVFAYDARSARTLLTDQGFVVTTKPSYTCLTPRRAIRTIPAAGTRVTPGTPVRLFVTAPNPNASCVTPQDSLAWRLLDFANHRGPAPDFAPQVSVYVHGRLTTLTAAEAGDPEVWGPHSALALLAASTRQYGRAGDRIISPSLSVYTDRGNDFFCDGQGLPREMRGRSSIFFDVQPPTPGFVSTLCTFANVFQTNGKIDALVVRTSRPEFAPAEVTAPDDPDGIGAKFLAYARGDTDGLPVGNSVRLYLGNRYEKTITAADIADRGSFDVCDVYAERSCPTVMSAVARLNDFAGQPSMGDLVQPGYCTDTLTTTPTDTGGTHQVVLGPSHAVECMDNFAIQIWYNDLGQITAVNLLLGAP